MLNRSPIQSGAEDTPNMPQEKIDAADVFDWDYLVRIGAPLELDEITNLDQGIQAFAYSFTSLASAEDQNRLLAEWLQAATHLQSKETNEEIVCSFAVRTNANLNLVRKFAKQNGIRLKSWL